MCLDVRAIGEAVASERGLRARDVRLDDIEVDDNRGSIEIGDQSHDGLTTIGEQAVSEERARSMARTSRGSRRSISGSS